MRSKTIDLAKGLCMLFIVIGHCLAPDNMLRWYFSSFHVPMFFFLSGLLFNDKKWNKFFPFFKARFMRLMWPCLIFTIIYSFISFLFLKDFYLGSLKYSLPGALWFLPILFICELLYYPIINIRKEIRPILLYAIALIGLFLPPPMTLYSTSSIPLSIVYYGLGHYSRVCKFELCLQNSKRRFFPIQPILLFSPLLYLLQTRDYVSFSENIMSYGSFLLSFIAITGILVFVLFIQELKMDRVEKCICWMSKNSIIIMACHMLLICLSIEYIAKYIQFKILYKIIEQVVLWVFLYVIVNIVNKKTPWIIGK